MLAFGINRFKHKNNQSTKNNPGNNKLREGFVLLVVFV